MAEKKDILHFVTILKLKSILRQKFFFMYIRLGNLKVGKL